MPSRHIDSFSRRCLLQFLAASPLFTQRGFAQGLSRSDPIEWAPRDLENLITDPRQALDVFEFEPVMKKKCSSGAFRLLGNRRQR
jgi:4-hydroxymandelate oxidase